jgi:arylsulfatase A-like enzyme
MSTRRKFLALGASAAAGAALAPGMGAVEAAAPRPNIVLILADDMGFSDIGCFGSEISTPNLDKLAARGMRMDQFYNNPRCCPSRASIMTGLYPHQVGMGMMADVDYGRYPFPAYAGDLSPRSLTLAEGLKSVGYKTAMVGKWHLTPDKPEAGQHNWPLQRGFDQYWGMIVGGSVYFGPTQLVQGNTHLPPVKDPSFYLTDAFADHAVEYLDELTKDKDPFFLYCAFNAPHWPIQAPEEDIAKYATRYAGGWDALRRERHGKQIAMGMVKESWPLSPRDPRVPPWEKAADKAWEMRRMAVYAAMIERLDAGIGRILAKLEASGAAENTLIVFMSDNGGNAEEIGVPKRQEQQTGLGEITRGNIPGLMPGSARTFQSIGIPWGNCANTPFRLYKHYAQEGGISSPFIACWPRVIRPTARPLHAVGHETDLMPTFLEVAGATYPRSVAAGPIPALVGESLMPLFREKTRQRGTIFWEHEGNKAVRDGQWKLVSRFPEGWELYDMEADRTEMNDLSKAQPARVEAMTKMYAAWAKEVGVQPWPMPQTPKEQRSGEMGTPQYLRSHV